MKVRMVGMLSYVFQNIQHKFQDGKLYIKMRQTRYECDEQTRGATHFVFQE